MRCPDCNKFVPYDDSVDPEMELEIQDQPEANDESPAVTVTGSVRIVLPCGECGTELKEATLDVDQNIDVPAKPTPDAVWADESEWEITSESASPEVRTEGKGRYTKTFYGYLAEITLSREYVCKDGVIGQETVDYQWTDDIQASSMDELV